LIDLYVRENLVFDSLIYLELVERFKNRSNVMKLRSFRIGDGILVLDLGDGILMI